jgi:O-antigen ligase
MNKNYFTLHAFVLLVLALGSVSLTLIHTNAFRYTFIEPKFALYDIISSSIMLYYFYYKKEFQLSLLAILSFIILLFMLLSMFQSANVIYSFELIFRFFNLTIFIALLYDLLKTKVITLQHIGNLLTFTSFIFIGYYYYGTHISHVFTSHTSFSSIGHINYTAHVLNIWIPIVGLNFFIQKNIFFKYTSLLVAIFLIDILIISGARGSIVGLILSEVFIVIILFIKYKKFKLYPLITLLLISLFILHKSLAPSSISHISNKIDRVTLTTKIVKTESTKNHLYKRLNRLSSSRLNAYNNTFDMILDNPWGVGAGNYEYIHPLYAKVGSPFSTPYVKEKYVWTNPHNIILKFFSELGWLGGLFFFILLLVLFKMTLHIILHGDTKDYFIAIGVGATLFHAMLSAVFLTPVQLFFVSFLFAVLLYRHHIFKSSKTLFSLRKIYGKAFLLFILLFFILFHLSKYYNNQFTTQRNFSYLEKAILLNPYNDNAIIKQAKYTAYAKHDYSLAIYYLEQYLKLYPYNIDGHIKKASFEYRMKRYKAALKTIEHLLSFDKKNKKMLNLKKRILTIRKNL